MRAMLTGLQVVSLAALTALAVAADDGLRDGRWVPLFDGKDLSGWTPKIKGYELGKNFGNTFRVEDGVLKVAYDQYDNFGGRFGHLFKHIIEGQTVFEYEQPQLDENDADARRLILAGEKMLHEGTISLQSESHPIEFRKVEILVLKE